MGIQIPTGKDAFEGTPRAQWTRPVFMTERNAKLTYYAAAMPPNAKLR